VNIREVAEDDVKQCYLIEKTCFEESEAASLNSIKNRVKVYPAGFIVAEIENSVVGMINSGSTDKDDITDEEFKKLIGHSENGKNIVIVSVSVLPEFQGKGIASILLKDFIERSENLKKEKILLLCKTDLIGFYKGLSFRYGSISKSTHGGFEWHEMVYNIKK
jgi:ribosomal protein S18 acetylase RimI-like enzyme